MRTTIFIAFVLLFTGLTFRLGWTLSPGFTIKQEPSHKPQPNLQIVAVADLPIVASLDG